MLRAIFTFVFMAWSQLVLAGNSPAPLRVGVIANDNSKTVISTALAVSPDDRIYIYKGDTTSPAEILNGSQLKPVEPDLNVSNFDSQGTVLSYALEGHRLSTNAGYYGLALIVSRNSVPGKAPEAGRKEGYISIKPGGDEGEVLVCTSSEGISVYARSDSVINHLYYSLGYDVESTCPDSIFE